jgi:hypothetical protein
LFLEWRYLPLIETQMIRQMERTQMFAQFPAEGKIDVPPMLAGDLLKGAERLPLYDNKEFYSTDLQTLVRDHLRDVSPDGFDWLADQIRGRLAKWPYCALVRGLHFDEGNRLFVGLNRAFGELVARPYEKPRAQLVHYVQPATDIPSARGGRETERLHTDTADWETPVELISMVCARADPCGGGRSRVLDVDTIRAEVEKHLGNDTLRFLESEAVPWQLAPYAGGGLKWRTVLTESTVCWRRYTIDLAISSGGATLPGKTLALLDAFEELLRSTDGTVDFLMREGELLFSNNWRTIHCRTPISNGNGSDRLMIRSWIRTS